MATALGSLLKSSREARGRTLTEVADVIGVRYPAVQQWEAGRTKPTPANLRKASEMLGFDLGQAMHLLSGGDASETGAGTTGDVAQPKPSGRVPLPPSTVVPAPDAPPYKSQAGRGRDVDELGIAVGGEDGEFDLNGEVLSRVPRPPALVGRDIFAVRVKSDSMSPRFEEGELLYVERRRQPAPGEDAIIELFPDEPDGAGRAFIKRLVSKGMQTVVAFQFNPEKTITYERERVKHLYRVVPRNEMFGV